MQGLEPETGSIVGRSVVGMSVSEGFGVCMFGTKGFANSAAAHRPADLEKCLL